MLQLHRPPPQLLLGRHTTSLSRPVIIRQRPQQSPRHHVLAPRATRADDASSSSKSSKIGGGQYGAQERVLDLQQLLKECEDEDDSNDNDELPLPGAFFGAPLTAEELAAIRAEEAAAAQAAPAQAEPSLEPLASAYEDISSLSPGALRVALAAGMVDLLLDVRSRAEFAAGPVIDGEAAAATPVMNIQLDELSDAVRGGQLDAFMARSVVAVCASGQRSAQATVRLSRVFGFANVSNLSGGMAAWQRFGEQQQQQGGGGGCGCGGGGGGGCH